MRKEEKWKNEKRRKWPPHMGGREKIKTKKMRKEQKKKNLKNEVPILW